MTHQRSASALPFLILALLLGLVFLPSPGTTDVDIWGRWMSNANARGLVAGFAANAADYPPLSTALLWAAMLAGKSFHLTFFETIKWSILIFWWLAALVFWLWTRDIPAVLLLYFALLLNSVALGYIDVYYTPALIAALWALQSRRWLLFSLLFTLACLIKWQPLILAPFIALYLLDAPVTDGERTRWTLTARIVLARVLLPAVVLIGLVLAWFGASPVWQAFRASTSHPYLSGNALNLSWIITHALHVLEPNQYGALQNGQATYIVDAPSQVTLVPRLLFAAAYLLALWAFWRREKTFRNLVAFSILGFLAYFAMNTGVHENHLLIPAVLACVLFWLDRETWPAVLGLVLAANLNMFLFYGVDGTLHFNRAVGGVDMALPLAVYFLLFFLWLTRFFLRRYPCASQKSLLLSSARPGAT